MGWLVIVGSIVFVWFVVAVIVSPILGKWIEFNGRDSNEKKEEDEWRQEPNW